MPEKGLDLCRTELSAHAWMQKCFLLRYHVTDFSVISKLFFIVHAGLWGRSVTTD